MTKAPVRDGFSTRAGVIFMTLYETHALLGNRSGMDSARRSGLRTCISRAVWAAPRNGELMWELYRVKDGKIVEHQDTYNSIRDDQMGKQW